MRLVQDAAASQAPFGRPWRLLCGGEVLYGSRSGLAESELQMEVGDTRRR